MDRSLVAHNDISLVSAQGTQVSKLNREHPQQLRKELFDAILSLTSHFAQPTVFDQTGNVKAAVESLIRDYWFYKLEDFLLMIEMGKRGEFGKVYHVDVQLLTEWLKCYDEQRDVAIENQNLSMKQEMNQPLENVDYEAYKARIEEEPEPVSKDDAFNQFKADYYKRRVREEEKARTDEQ